MATSDRDLERRVERLEDADRAARRPEVMRRLKATFAEMSDEEFGEWAVTSANLCETKGDEAELYLGDPPLPTPGYARWVELGGLEAFVDILKSVRRDPPEAVAAISEELLASQGLDITRRGPTSRSRAVARALREHREPRQGA